jgi:hypothetical protein
MNDTLEEPEIEDDWQEEYYEPGDQDFYDFEADHNINT